MNNTAYVTIAAYFVLMMVVGFLFTRLNKNEDDYLRGGCRASWWMVGMSSFMANFSAWTFTGAAGAVYMSGWSVLWIFGGNIIGYILVAIFFAPWYRQTRKTAFGEVVEARFNNNVAQFFTWIGLPTMPFGTAGALYGLGIFITALTGFDMRMVIIVVGVVVLTYALTGGAWATMATDFVQGMILVPFTIILAVLCLIEVGGFSGLFSEINAQGLSEQFALIKPEGYFPDNKYTSVWAMATVFSIVTGFISLGQALRYRSVKTGADARKAAWLSAILFILGSFIWFIPPAYARLFLSVAVEAMPLAHAQEGAFAATSLNLLPPALHGVLLVAILSASMSSMDGAIGAFGATIVKVCYPGLCKLFRRKPTTNGKTLLLMSRLSVLFFGGVVIWVALYFESQKLSFFDLMFDLMAFLTAMGVPFIWAFFVRKVPAWSFYTTMLIGIIPAFMGVYSEQLFGTEWNFQTKLLMNIGIASAAFYATRIFWSRTTQEYRDHVDEFFKTINTPIDLKKEVGDVRDTDVVQMRLSGGSTLAFGLFLCALTLTCRDLRDVIIVLSLSLTVTLIGGAMFTYGTIGRRKLIRELELEAHHRAATSPDDSEGDPFPILHDSK